MSPDTILSDTPIYDELYGYIDTTPLELEIIDTALFQRLNHIKQLGMAYRVFPGAQHTRFSHSLGTMHLMDRMARSLELPKEEREKLRLAALLHDVGHYPFSHTLETVFTNHHKNEDATHEKLGAFVINQTEIKDKLLANGYSKSDILEIISIIQGNSANVLHNQLMTSELDADRLDYLLRDSASTGVVYGKVDLNRIMHTLALDNEGYLSIEEGGKGSAEGYIVSRYLMWATIYTHKATAGFDELVQHMYPLIADTKYLGFDNIKKLSAEEFVAFDDSYVLSKIHEAYRKKDGSYLSELSRKFIEREHLELVDQQKMLTDDREAAKRYNQLDAFGSENHLKALSTSSGVDENWIFHNNSNTALPTLRPILEKYLAGEKPEDKEMQKALRIRKDGTSLPLSQDKNSIVYSLQDLSLDVVRLFTKDKKFATRLREVLETYWS